MFRKYSIRASAFLSLMVLSLTGMASASPLYYTFEGSVSGFYTDGPGGYHSETSAHYSLGQSISLVFMADLALPAYSTVDGSDFIQNDDGWGHYFKSSYVSGDAIPTDFPAAYSYISHYGYTAASQSGLTGSNGDPTGFDQVRVDNYGKTFYEWTPGMGGFGGQDLMFNGSYREFNYFSLTLTSTSSTAPSTETVPEPTTLALTGLGLLGLAAAARKRRRI